ncbi:MAG: sigma-54 dependent transcriptional regulator [Terriglobales bacterium]
MNQTPTILVVSREPSVLSLLEGVAGANSWRMESAFSRWEALERVQSEDAPGLVLLDLVQSDADGLHTLHWLRRIRPDLPVVVLAHSENGSQKAEAIRLGAQDYLSRPFEEQHLQMAIGRHLTIDGGNSALAIGSENIEHIDNDVFLVAASPAMRHLRAQAELLAQVDAPVLILGERDSGKQIVARLLHKLSIRSGFQFLKISCAALPSDLLETELFGQERRVVAGTSRTNTGKLETCEKGTLFLDEISELPASLQTKLMHILQDKYFVRVGGDTRVAADVRILAASHTRIEQLLAEGKLREDLYYRLSAFSVYVPPLRKRREDIPLLMGHYMNRLARHYDIQARTFSSGMLHACQTYAWPGNLRELESFVKRYLVVGDEELSLRELERKLAGNGNGHGDAERLGTKLELVREAEADPGASASLRSLVQSVKGEAEKNAIAGALGQTHWNRKAAARLLRVSYRTLLYKIQQYNLTPPTTYLPEMIPGIKSNGHGQ